MPIAVSLTMPDIEQPSAYQIIFKNLTEVVRHCYVCDNGPSPFLSPFIIVLCPE